MIEVRIKCPACNTSLMDDSREIDGTASICVVGEAGGRKGKIWLSSLYGSYNVESRNEISEGDVTTFFCPECHEELKSTRICELCEAPMIPFSFAEAGIVQICSRRGCKRHLVEFSDIRAELRSFVDSYFTFC